MVEYGILLITKKKTLRDNLERLINHDNYQFYSSGSLREIRSRISEYNIIIILMDRIYRNYSVIRNIYHEKPVQIIYLCEKNKDISELSKSGFDDFIRLPVDETEFMYRIKASFIRYKQQLNIIEERNFFRQAVKNEEALSLKILDQHMHLKQAFSNIELINAELSDSNEKLEKIARFDLLSGLLNRMSLFSIIDLEIERANRTGTALTGMMLDIDDFKELNDNHGHLIGDRVIKIFGSQLRKTLRKYDHAGRYGGEEFFVLLPNTELSLSYNIAERFRKLLEETDIFDNDNNKLPVTVSIGLAELQKNESREKWIDRADQAMYSAKRSGKNMTVIYSTE